jgi:hypothetical protein
LLEKERAELINCLVIYLLENCIIDSHSIQKVNPKWGRDNFKKPLMTDIRER